MKKATTATSSILSAALVAAFSFSAPANAASTGDLFSAQNLDRGYMAMVGEGKCGEGKCGGDGDKDKDKDKGGEGKCGEGRCGG